MRITLPESAGWPFDPDATEMSAAEFQALIAGQSGGGLVIPPAADVVPDWKTNEKAFQERVRKFAVEHGYQVYHTWSSANSAPGFPDCVFARDRILTRVAELKVGSNRPTKDQQWWLEAFMAAGIPAEVWTPEMWGYIEEVLR